MTYTPAADPLLTPFARQLRRDLTPADRLLWSKLRGGRQQGLKFRRQDPIGPFIADFVCEAAKLVVEVDGSQHADNRDYDERRSRWFESKGYRIVRFWNGEVMTDMDSVVRVIVAAASCPRPPTATRRAPASPALRERA